MGDAHDRAVTRNRLQLENALDEGYWDEVFTEKSYYENQSIPHIEPPSGDKGREVGEFDYLAVNLDDKTYLYGEVKTGRGDLAYADDQHERAEDFFAPEWQQISQTALAE